MTTKFDFEHAREYLATGGLGEVIGLTSGAIEMGSKKIQMDTDMLMELCLLADEALKARKVGSQTSDGEFQWWIAGSKDAEHFYGPFASKEEAVAQSNADYDDQFYVVEADKSVINAYFDRASIAERIMESLCENNEECFGEDGPDGPWDSYEGADKALEKALNDAVSAWLKAYPGKTWTFGTYRHEEVVKVAANEEAVA